jgi:hypothetical protein
MVSELASVPGHHLAGEGTGEAHFGSHGREDGKLLF